MSKRVREIKTINYTDFSPKSVKKALTKHSFNHWTFKYALVGAMITGISALLFGATPLKWLMLGGFLGVSLFSLVYNFLFGARKFGDQYIAKLNQMIERERKLKKQRLSDQLGKMNQIKGQKQLSKVQEKFENLCEVLKDKFAEDEMAFRRYYGVSQEVVLSVFDNLSEIANAHLGISDIQVEDLKHRIEDLNKTVTSENDSEEHKALSKRLMLHGETTKRIDKMYVENEKALTALDESTVAISKINPLEKQSKVDLEISLKELELIAERATLFAQ